MAAPGCPFLSDDGASVGALFISVSFTMDGYRCLASTCRAHALSMQMPLLDPHMNQLPEHLRESAAFSFHHALAWPVSKICASN
jgi:hypothetical protein